MGTMYQENDYVRYGSNGVCLILEITQLSTPERPQPRQYYVLRPVADSSAKIFVPMDRPALVQKMHPILTKDQIDGALHQCRAQGIPWVSERTLRTVQFREILKKAEPLELLQLCCCIYHQRHMLADEGKALSGSDAEILKQAEKLIETEFSFSLQIPRAEVGPYIQQQMQSPPSP